MNSDTLNEARRDLTDVIEEVGAVSMHLREAIDLADGESIPNAEAIVDDALNAIDNAIRELLKIRDHVGRWAVWAAGKEGA